MDIITRIETFRALEPPMPFSAIASQLTIETGKIWTKDQTQKLYTRQSKKLSRLVVVVSDIHAAPDEELTRLILDIKPDLLVVAGDLFDENQFSRHPRGLDETKKTFRHEMEVNRKWLKILAANIAKIELLWGNHDHWLYGILAEILPDDVLEYFPDVLALASEGLGNVSVSKMPVEAVFPNGSTSAIGNTRYMAWVGDCLVSHANFSGSKPGFAVSKLYDWVQEWRRPLGWPEPAVYIQAHGHKMAMLDRQGGYSILVEPGMGGTPSVEGYKVGYQAKWQPGNLGAVRFVQELVGNNWKTKRETVELIRPRR